MSRIVAKIFFFLFVVFNFSLGPVSAQECSPRTENGRSFTVDVFTHLPQNLEVLDGRIEVLHSEPAKLIAKFNAGNEPDAVVLGYQHLQGFAEAGVLVTLDEDGLFEPFLPDSQMLKVGKASFALPLFATSRVWVIRKDIAEKSGLGIDFEYDSAFEILNAVKDSGYSIGLDYGNGYSAAADYLAIFNGLSNNGNGLKEFPKFDSDAGRKALEILKKLSEYSKHRNADSNEIAARFVMGDYIAMSAWAHTADRAFEMAQEQGQDLDALVIAPPPMSPDQRQNIPIYWQGLAFTASIAEDDMKFVYCQIQKLFAPTKPGDPRSRPLLWAQDGLVWSRGGEGVISAFGRGASYVPSGSAMLKLEVGLGEAIPQALKNGADYPARILNQLDSQIQQDIDERVEPLCLDYQSCFTPIPDSFIWKTGGGNTCSTSECSSGQHCCDGKCSNKPCKRK